MAVQPFATETTSYRLTTARRLAPNVRKIVRAYHLEGIKSFVQFKEWQKSHVEIPLSFWHYMTVFAPSRGIHRSSAISPNTRPPQAGVNSAQSPAQTAPIRINTNDFLAIEDLASQLPEIPLITPDTHRTEPLANTRPLIVRNERENIATSQDTKTKEGPQPEMNKVLLAQVLPASLQIANPRMLPTLTRKAYEERLKKKHYLKYIPHVVVKKEEKTEEKPLARDAGVPHEEYSFRILSPVSQAVKKKAEEKQNAITRLRKLAGIFIAEEPEDEKSPPIDIALEDVLDEYDPPELELTIDPEEAERQHDRASADPVFRLFQDTGFAAALHAYQQTGEEESFVDHILAWTHVFAENFVKKAEKIGLDDIVTHILTSDPESPIRAVFAEHATEPVYTHPFDRKTIRPPLPGEKAEDGSEDQEYGEAYEASETQETTQEPSAFAESQEPYSREYHEDESSHQERHYGHTSPNQNPSHFNPPGRQTLQKQLKKVLIRQAVTAPAKTPWPWIIAGVIIFLLLFVAILLRLSKNGDTIESKTAKELAVTKLTVTKAARYEGGIAISQIKVNFGDENYQGRGTDIVITDRISDNATVEKGTTEPYTYDASTHTITWSADQLEPLSGDFTKGRSFNPIELTVMLRPTEHNTYVFDQATANVIGWVDPSNPNGSPVPGTGVINTNSQSLDAIFQDAAQRSKVPVNVLKAIAHTETQVLTYNESEFKQFSTTSWWEGKVDSAPTLNGNDKLIIRGYAYNTCQYTPACYGSDVRGAMQFLLSTWNNIKKSLSFTDGHDPDRRNVSDIVYGAAQYVRNTMDQSDSKFGYSKNADPNVWTFEQVSAVTTAYCTGSPYGNPSDPACAQSGQPYNVLAWNYYKEIQGIK